MLEVKFMPVRVFECLCVEERKREPKDTRNNIKQSLKISETYHLLEYSQMLEDLNVMYHGTEASLSLDETKPGFLMCR